MPDADLREALRWDRRMIAGMAVVFFALFALISVLLILVRKDIVDIRVAATALSGRVDAIDTFGSKALHQHELAAHDRAK